MVVTKGASLTIRIILVAKMMSSPTLLTVLISKLNEAGGLDSNIFKTGEKNPKYFKSITSRSILYGSSLVGV